MSLASSIASRVMVHVLSTEVRHSRMLFAGIQAEFGLDPR